MASHIAVQSTYQVLTKVAVGFRSDQSNPVLRTHCSRRAQTPCGHKIASSLTAGAILAGALGHCGPTMLSAREQQQPQAQNWEPCPLKDLEPELGLSPPSLPLCWCCHCCCMSVLRGQPWILELAGHEMPEQLVPELCTLRLRVLDALL